MFAALLALRVAAVATPATAQIAPRLDLGGNVEVGGEAERYLRILQVSGAVPITSWTTQPFTIATARALIPTMPHPWQARLVSKDTGRAIRWLRPSAQLTLNTTYPVQDAVGPVWQGRGITAALQGGLVARWRGIGLQLAPLAFMAQNADFELAPNGFTDSTRFGDARFPVGIDYPQRFGESAYGRVDLGTSTLSLDGGLVAAGLSNAPQRWGPAREYPLVLGPGAGGFPHAYLGTGGPVHLWLFDLQGRLIAGTLTQTAYSTALPGNFDRFVSAAMFSIAPRGVNGLELGFTRFFVTTEPASLEHLLRPFSLVAFVGAIGDTVFANQRNENQIASLFFRWTFPQAGAEVYGEWYREDFPGDLRKAVVKPDDLSSFMVGMQRVFGVSATRRRVFRFEFVNGELSHQERGQRGFLIPIPPYIHGEVFQGHTQRGLILGSPEAYGGAGWRFSLDEYTARGRRTIALERALRFDWLPARPAGAPADVIFGLRFEALRFAGEREFGVTVVPAVDLNRNLERGADRFNLHVTFTTRGWR